MSFSNNVVVVKVVRSLVSEMDVAFGASFYPSILEF